MKPRSFLGACLTLATACASFGESSLPVDGSVMPQTEAGAEPVPPGADAATQDPRSPVIACNPSTVGFRSPFSEGFDRWSRDSESNVGETMLVTLGVPPAGYPTNGAPQLPWARAKATLTSSTDADRVAIVEQGVEANNPSIVRLEYDFAVAQMDSRSEAGCRIELRSGAGLSSEAYSVYFTTTSGRPGTLDGGDDRFDGTSYKAGGETVAVPGYVPTKWQHVVVHMTMDGTTGPRTTFQIDGASPSKTLEDPKLSFEVKNVVAICGIAFMEKDGGPVIVDVGFDNVDLAVCPD